MQLLPLIGLALATVALAAPHNRKMKRDLGCVWPRGIGWAGCYGQSFLHPSTSLFSPGLCGSIVDAFMSCPLPKSAPSYNIVLAPGSTVTQGKNGQPQISGPYQIQDPSKGPKTAPNLAEPGVDNPYDGSNAPNGQGRIPGPNTNPDHKPGRQNSDGSEGPTSGPDGHSQAPASDQQGQTASSGGSVQQVSYNSDGSAEEKPSTADVINAVGQGLIQAQAARNGYVDASTYPYSSQNSQTERLRAIMGAGYEASGYTPANSYQSPNGASDYIAALAAQRQASQYSSDTAPQAPSTPPVTISGARGGTGTKSMLTVTK